MASRTLHGIESLNNFERGPPKDHSSIVCGEILPASLGGDVV